MPLRNGIGMNDPAVPKSGHIGKSDPISRQIVRRCCLKPYAAKDRPIALHHHRKTERLGASNRIRRINPPPPAAAKEKSRLAEYTCAMTLCDPECVESAAKNRRSEDHADADFGKHYARFPENADFVPDYPAGRSSPDEFAEKCNL